MKFQLKHHTNLLTFYSCDGVLGDLGKDISFKFGLIYCPIKIFLQFFFVYLIKSSHFCTQFWTYGNFKRLVILPDHISVVLLGISLSQTQKKACIVIMTTLPMCPCPQLEGSDRSGSNLSLQQIRVPSRGAHDSSGSSQSPNKVTRSQSATSGTSNQKSRRYSQGGTENNGNGSTKRWCFMWLAITYFLAS